MTADVDAPTTLPQATELGLAERLGGMMTQQRKTLQALSTSDRAHPVEPFVLYALTVLALHASETYRYLALLGDAPGIAAKRLFDVVLRAGRTDLVVVVCAAATVGVIAAVRGRRPIAAAIATTYLLVPLTVLKAIGGILALLGHDFWLLPHHAVDSMAVVVNGQLDARRFLFKCVVAYGDGLLVLLGWFVVFRKDIPAPRAVVARAGAAFVVALTAALVLLAGADVARRADELRPRLGGDAFPSLSLPLLEGKGRLDPITLVTDGAHKVLIVDFWASWCGPCKRSLPELSALASTYADKGVAAVGVNREPRDRAAARAAWAALTPSFPSVVDNAGLGERLGLTSLPSSYLVDASGHIRHVHLGYTDIAVVRAEVEALLAETP